MLSSSDILNLSLSISILILALLLAVALFYLIFILRDLARGSAKFREAAELIDKAVRQPWKIGREIFLKSKFLAEWVRKVTSKDKR